jgi:tetratricopeptide (TPR) repeat protein
MECDVQFKRLGFYVEKKMNRMSLILPALVLVAATACSRSPQAVEMRALDAGKKYFDKKDYDRAVLEFGNASRAVPSDAEPHYRLALAYLANGNVFAAAKEFQKTIDLKPDHKDARIRLAGLLALSTDKDTVEEGLHRAAEILHRWPDDADARKTVALAELRLGNTEKAKRDFEEILQKFPGDFDTAVNLARAKLLLKDIHGAEVILKQAVSAAAPAPGPLTTLGEFYLIIGQPSDAEQQFRKALALSPMDVTALRNLGEIQWRGQRQTEADETYRKLSMVPEKRYRAAHAMFLITQQKQAEAVAELEQLLKSTPENHDLRTDLVWAYMVANKSADAERLLQAELKNNPADIDALLQRSRLYLGQGKDNLAEADLTQVLRFRADSAEAHYLLAKVYRKRSQHANEQQQLGEALRLAPALLAARLDLARMLTGTQGARSALKLLDETPARQKANAEVLVQRNWAWLALGETAPARQSIEQLLHSGRDPEVVLQLAVTHFMAREYEAARSAVEEVLKSRPDEARGLELLMRIYAAQQQPEKGLQKLAGYAALSPENVAMQRVYAHALNSAGKHADAESVLEKTRQLRPESVDLAMDLAQLEIADGKLDAARQHLTQALPSDTAEGSVGTQLAEVEIAAGNYAAAIELYRKVVQVNSRNVKALNNLAYLLCDFKQQPDEALKYAQQAKELAPENPFTDDTLGWTYYQKGLYSMAVRHLESAAARESTARRKFHLAMAYLKAGNSQKGKESLQAALRMDPSIPEAVTAKLVLAQTVSKIH